MELRDHSNTSSPVRVGPAEGRAVRMPRARLVTLKVSGEQTGGAYSLFEVEVGELQTFTIRITNEGNRRAEGVRMTDPLPSKVRFIRASTSREVPGSCGIEDRVVTCRLGPLRPDRAVTVKIYVKPVVAGSYTNRAYVSYTSPTARALEADSSDNSDAARALVEARRP